jgi:hypothetical protein
MSIITGNEHIPPFEAGEQIALQTAPELVWDRVNWNVPNPSMLQRGILPELGKLFSE